MTVREMLSRMDSYELAEWKVLYGMEPWGEARDDYRSALQTANLMDVHRDRKKRSTPFPVKDFLLTFKEQEEQQPVTASPEKLEKAKAVVAHINQRLAQIELKRALRGRAA